MISVVIPLYNKENHIADTINHVLAQTYRNFEVVIVDDGSSDKSATIVKNISDTRIRFISQTNAGVSAARNRGIAEAQGEYIALLDADDEWYPDYLASQMALVEKYPDCDVFAINYEFRDEHGHSSPTKINSLPFNGADGILTNYFKVASCSNPPLWTSAVMARKAAFESVGGFPVGIVSGEDLLTWARLACRYNIAFSMTPKAVYYTPTTGPTGKAPGDLKIVKDAVSIELKKLACKYPDNGVNRYIAFWYKMRASINLKFYNRKSSIRCALASICHYPFSLVPWAIIILSCMPKNIITKSLRK